MTTVGGPGDRARMSEEALARDLEGTLAELAAEKRRIELFHRAGERMNATSDLDTLGDVMVRELGDAVGAEAGALWAVDGEDDVLRLQSCRGVERSALPDVLRAGAGVAGRAVVAGRLVGEEDQVAVPLRAGGEALGVLSLGKLDAVPFGADELDTLERLAEQAAVALAHVVAFRRAVRQAEVNRAVLDAVPDPLGLLGPGGEMVAENTPMAELRAEVGDVDAGGPGEARDEVVVGDRTYTRYAAPVRDGGGARMGRIVALRDVTAEREAERLKDEFFALVSHELRTPLTSIIGYLELVLDDEHELSADARRFLEVVDRNAERLLRLVGDMLFVAQLEAGRVRLERRPVELATVVADSVEAARPAAERAGVALELHAEDVGAVEADRDRVGQVVDNLVSNALKFTPRGGRVTVRLGREDDDAVLAVGDDGVGIPSEEQSQLFERFFRSSNATRKAVPGVGLGLTIVKSIAEAHGGSVVVESREGEGTTVTVRLPA